MALEKAFWEQYAPHYGLIWNEVKPNRDLLHEAFRRAMIDDHQRVLDVCCGNGVFLNVLQEHGRTCQVTGLDFSPAMLEQARRQPYDGRAEFFEVDLNRPLSDWPVTGLYDRIIFTNGLYAFADPRELLRKLAALAVSEALMVVSLPVPKPDQDAIFDACLGDRTGEERQQEAGRLFETLEPIMPFNRQIALEGNFPTEEQLPDWFENTDWEFITTTRAYAGQNWMVVVQRR